MSKLYVQETDLRPAAPCYCGSGRTFSECCGCQAPDRPCPVGIIVRKAWLDKSRINPLIRYAEKQRRVWLTIVDNEKSVPGHTVYKRDPTRVTQSVHLVKKQQTINRWFREIMLREVALAWNREVEWFEQPYLLRYCSGGFYHEHTDAELKDPGDSRFYRIADRDVSLLLYLNDDFDGGDLTFTRLNYQIKPGRGDLIMFPSDHRFTHRAEPVTSGVKFALVSWAALQGTPRVTDGAQPHYIRI